MRKTGLVLTALLGLLIGFAAVAPQVVEAQDFPYSVPQAPEFDNGGNSLPSGQTDAESPPRRKRSRARQEQPPPESWSDYRTVRPYVPQDAPPPAQQPVGPRAPRGPAYQRPTGSPPPMATAPPPGAGPAQDRPDCSQYPMMIARSRSEPEMQAIARQYLTCLLKSGWPMEQARTHVIKTIQGTYELAR
jgi:hypothetical protein